MLAADAAKPNAWRRIFSFPVMIAMALTMLAVLSVRDRFNDPDLWWHLKTGEIIWNTHSIPTTDLFSFSTNQHAWTAHEWLSQTILFAAWKIGGNSGVMVLLCLLTALLLIVSYGLSWLYSGNGKVALLGSLIVWLLATVGLSARPHMFGYLLLGVELLLLELGRRGHARWLWALPALFAVWVNLHGSFLLGIVILGITLLGFGLQFELGLLKAERWPAQTRRTLTAVFVLSLAALLLNPVGLRQLIYPLDVMFRQQIGTSVVAEWQPLAFGDLRGIFVLVAASLVLLLPLLWRVELYVLELVFAAGGFLMAVQHQRMTFVFGLLVAPVLCRLLANSWDRYDPRRDSPVANALMIALFAFGIYWGFPSPLELQQQITGNNPARAVEYLKNAHLSGNMLRGNMLNDYTYGGYLIWTAPEHKVFIDGRADVYEWTGVMRDMNDWYSLQTEPTALLDKYHISFCFLSATSPMARVILLLPGWKEIYRDQQAVIISRS